MSGLVERSGPHHLPDDLVGILGGAELFPVVVGGSDSQVLRAVRPDGDWFVKLTPHRHELETTPGAEATRLEWLAGRLPVPEVISFGSDDQLQWLVTTALRGSDATRPDHQGDAGRLVSLFAEGLRRIHDNAVGDGCPFDASTDTLLEIARTRVGAGLVDESDFDSLYRGLSAEELLGHLVELRPDSSEDLVLTHGDYCVPNVIVDRGQLSGYVDVGRAGLGDRYRDLAVAARSVVVNFGGQLVGPMFDAYGIEWPDLPRVDFFVMLDELF